MKSPITLIALLLATVATGSQAHTASDAPHSSSTPAAAKREAAQEGTLSPVATPVAVRYRVNFTPAKGADKKAVKTPPAQDWYFIRQPEMIATLRPENAEVWRQTPQGLSLERVFHSERHIVEYTPGELKTLGIQPSWQQLGSLFDAQSLDQLRPGPRHGSLQTFSGKLQGESVRLTWDHALQLPERLERSSKAGRVSMLLQPSKDGASWSLARISAPNWPSGWPQSENALKDYQRLDAADFGDMDYDPVVRKAEAMDVQQGLRKAHAHD